MDAVEFVKTVNRICKKGCKKCPIYKERMCMSGFDDDSVKNIVEKVLIVEQWAKEHPEVTRKSEFLKLFPDAEMVNIERTFCVAHFEPTKKCKVINPSEEQCIACRYRFWNEEVTDDD